MDCAEALYALEAADSTMLPSKILVALRKKEDVERTVSFLKGIGERPRLLFASLDFRDIADDLVVEFENSKPNDRPVEGLSGFEHEFSRIPYRVDKLPASAFLEEATRKHCGGIIVVSSSTNTDALFHTDLASTITVESSIPVMVVR